MGDIPSGANPFLECIDCIPEMNILHVENQAGVANQLAQAQRRLGHHAVVMETWFNTLSEPHDVEFYYTHRSLAADLRNARAILRYAKDFDVVHLHGGMYWKRFDAVAIKLLLRKPMIVHYHGSETRDRYGMRYQFLADRKLVSRPDLLKWHPRARYVPNPVGEHPYRFDLNARPRVLHMATNRKAKGTDLIEKCLKELEQEGLDFEHVILDRVPHPQAMEELFRSHILIDQVIPPTRRLPSIIGVASLEAMAMGKVAISTFDEEYRRYYPGCPEVVIAPEADALKRAVRNCVGDLSAMKELGLKGREYVKGHHSADAIVKDVMATYEEAMSRRSSRV